MNSRPHVSLKLLGSPSIQGPDGMPLGGQPAQRHRIALLTLLARSPERGVSREKLLALLWPENDAEHARNLLNVSVYVLRRALGDEALISSAEHLRLNPEAIRADVVEFDASVQAGEPGRATALYEGPFLDGFFLPNAPELERWVTRERDRLAGAYAKALEELAEAAEAHGDAAAAVEWWKRRAAHDPYDSRVARRLMQAFENAGNPAAALQHASVHERLLRQEFGVGPDPETHAVVAAIRQRRESVEHLPERPPPGQHELGDRRSDDGGAEEVRRHQPEAAAEPSVGQGARKWGLGLASAAFVVALLGVTALLFWLGPRGLAGASGDSGRLFADRAGSDSRREPPPRSIAVLPFANFSADSGEEYFSDGLAEELIGTLARIEALRVVARTSSFAFKGRTGDVREIGEALNVATVLEGSVRRDGERVLVTVQLIDVADGFHLWAETYERRFTEIFDLQRELALQIATALEAELTPVERARLAARPTDHLEAYTAYLKGRHFWNERTPIGYERAIDYFGRATAIDPDYAEAWAGLAGVYSLQGLAGARDARTAGQLARSAASRAIELDADNAEARTVLGLYLHTYEWDAAAAEREFRRAIAIDPGNVLARQSYGNLLGAMGRLDEALEHKRRAVELDPLVPPLNETLAFTLVRAGRLDEAGRHVQNALELDSTYWRAHAVAGLIHERRGRHGDAIAAYERANELARGTTHRTRADIARVLAQTGRRDEARRLVNEMRGEAEATGVYEPGVATALLALGDTGAALAWLEDSFRRRHPHLAFIGGDARFAGFEREPRFAEMMRQVGLWR